MKLEGTYCCLRFIGLSAAIQAILFLLAYLSFSGNGISEEEESLLYFLFFSAAPFLSIVGFLWLSKTLAPALSSSVAQHWAWLVPPGAIALFGFAHAHKLVYFTYEVPPPELPLSGIRFALGVACFAVVAGILHFHLSRTRQRGNSYWLGDAPIPEGLKLVGVALVVSLFDVYMMIDSASYAPYVAPAFLVASGQRPMIDVFSQYGPNFLIFAAAFKVLPASFFTVAALVALLNILMYLTFVGIAVNIARNRTVVFVVSVCVVLFIHSAHLYNINYTPSVFAMRFLPPLLLVYALSLLRAGRLFSIPSILALALCSLWAVETAVFGVAAYFAFVALDCIGNRRPISYSLGAFGLIFAVPAFLHICVWVGYQIAFGLSPDYSTYFQLVFVHLEETDAVALPQGRWTLLIEPGMRVWVLFGFAYATVLALAAHLSLRRFSHGERFSRINPVLAAISVLGILMLYYYIGRSATPILMFISLPVFLIFVALVDWAVSGLFDKQGDAPPDAEGTAAKVTLLIFLIAFPLMGGVFADKFFRPYSQHLSNSTALRALAPRFGGQPISVRERLATWRSTIATDTYPQNEAGGSLTYTYPENKGAFELIKRLHTTHPRILMFITDPVPVIFHTPQARRRVISYPPHAAGLTYPPVDGLSSNLTQRTFQALGDIRVDDVVLVGELPRARLDEKVLSHLRQAWLLCKFDSFSKVTAYKLRPKLDTSCSS